MINVKYGSLVHHNWQILSGLSMYAKKTGNAVGFREDKRLFPCEIQAEFSEIVISWRMEDYWRIADSSRFEPVLSKDSDVVFKRSYRKDLALKEEDPSRIFPMPPNYACYDNKIGLLIAKERPKSAIKFCLGFESYHSFEKQGTKQKPTILFMTRLWDPDSIEVENRQVSEQRHEANLTRIRICELLRKVYGQTSLCGISDSDYARKVAPHLIVPKILSFKPRYLKAMKAAKLCICSLGLHKSNGWRFGEFLASGKCIVCENPYYEIPDAVQGLNYHTFSDEVSCLEVVARLIDSPELSRKTEEANVEYYNKVLRPDKLIDYALRSVGV